MTREDRKTQTRRAPRQSRSRAMVDSILDGALRAYAHPLDAPMSALGYRVVNLDFAVAF